MSIIGIFEVQPNGTYRGKIHTLTVRCPAQMIPTNSQVENAPQYRIFSGPTEIGAAWEKVKEETGMVYYTVELDDPSFPVKIYAALFQDKLDGGVFRLVWERAKPAN